MCIERREDITLDRFPIEDGDPIILFFSGRYLFLNAIANQLRYPNSHTHFFSCALLSLFAETNHEAIQEQITRYEREREHYQ